MSNGLSAEDAELLLERARQARNNSYSPYSGYAVGAALLDSEGEIHLGVNVENAAYGSTICAERVALTRAVADGVREFVALAVVGQPRGAKPETEMPCPPCGSCRQVVQELMPEGYLVLGAPGALPLIMRVADLLPHAFTGEALRR